jgi:hypothetical protein
LATAVDLAIDAIEIADFVRVQVHTDRDAAGSPAKDRVDKPVVLEEPGVVSMERKGGQFELIQNGQRRGRLIQLRPYSNDTSAGVRRPVELPLLRFNLSRVYLNGASSRGNKSAETGRIGVRGPPYVGCELR